MKAFGFVITLIWVGAISRRLYIIYRYETGLVRWVEMSLFGFFLAVSIAVLLYWLGVKNG